MATHNVTRLVFDLVRRHRSAQSSEERAGLVAQLADPRAIEWLEALPRSDAVICALARCTSMRRFAYPFIGSAALHERARSGLDYQGVAIEPDCLRMARPFLADESRGEVQYAIYVVVEESHAVLAPWRSEHVVAAKGRDVLAAGVVGFSGGNIEVLTNQSGGYLPAPASFSWARLAFERAGIDVPFAGFTELWPPSGYFSDDFLASGIAP